MAIVIYDAVTGATLNEIEHGPVYSVVISPSGKQIAVGGVSEQNEAIIYGAESETLVEMVIVMNNLARNQDSIGVVKVLNAGGEIAVPSFVLQHDDYLLNP